MARKGVKKTKKKKPVKKSLIPKNIGKAVEVVDAKETTEPVGKLGNYVGQRFQLKGTDGSGQVVEWIVKPTGSRSFELTVPKSHELGTPNSWENISIMTQRVTCKSGGCGCDGNQCGCQGSNCGSNCMSNRGAIRLLSESHFNMATVDKLREKLGL